MTIQSPYVGPRSFGEDENAIFFGRSEEADKLRALILANRAVVVFGPSGAGKTSLINAGLVPQLDGEGFHVANGVRVTGPMQDGGKTREPGTVIEHNAALSLAEVGGGQPLPDGERPTLAATLAGLRRGQDDADEMLVVFDQFEELFANPWFGGRDSGAVMARLSDLLETFPTLHIAFCVREEWLADIDEHALRFRNSLAPRLRLRGLRAEQARQAIAGPLEASGSDVRFSPEAIEKMLADLRTVHVEDAAGDLRRLSGDFVEPVQLQVVCSAIWQKKPEDRREIVVDDLDTFGSVDNVLAEFYDSCIEQVTSGRYEDELFLRNWFEHQLVTSSGTRGLVHMARDHAGGVPIDRVYELQALHIVRLEHRSGARWVELSHDRLIEPVRRANFQWRETKGQNAVAAAQSTFRRIWLLGTVRLGVTLTPPFCFENAAGILTGESIAVSRRVFQELGINHVEPVFSEFSRLDAGLYSGKFEIVGAGMVITAARQKQVRFSHPTVVSGFGFLVPQGNPKDLRSFEDVRDTPGAIVGVSKGTEEHDVAIRIGIPPERIVGFPRAYMAVDALRAGRIDAFATMEVDLPVLLDHAGAESLERADPFGQPVIDGEPYRGYMAFTMRKADEDLAERVDEVLKRFVGTKEHADLVAPFGITRDMLPDI